MLLHQHMSIVSHAAPRVRHLQRFEVELALLLYLSSLLLFTQHVPGVIIDAATVPEFRSPGKR